MLISVDLEREFFSQDIFDDLKELTEKIEEIDEVVEVKTPLQSTTIIQKKNELQILSFGEALDRGVIGSVKKYKKRFLKSEYFGRLLSFDHRTFAIVVKVDAPPDRKNFKARQRVTQACLLLLKGYPKFSNHMFSGEVEMNYRLDLNSRNDLFLLLPFTALLIIILLFFIFKSFLKALLILLTALSSLFAVFSVSVLMGHPITVIGMSLPILILVIAIADSVHIMSRWQSLSKVISDQELLLKETIRQTWSPCLMTTITTSVGFGVFYFSELIPLEYFGLDSAISIFLAYGIIMGVMWGGLYLVGPGLYRKEREVAPKSQTLNNFLGGIYRFSSNYHIAVIILSLSLMAAAGYLLKYAYTETNFLDVFFKKSSPTYQAFDHVDEKLGGTGSVDVIFKAEEDAFKTIHSLKQLVKVEKTMKEYELVKHVQSYLNPIRMIHKEFREKKEKLPKNKRQLQQEILFLEFSRGAEKNDVLSPYIDFLYENSRMHIQTPNLNSTLSRQIKNFIQERLRELNIQNIITGSSVYFEILSNYVFRTQIVSILIASLFIWILFIANFGFRLGSLGMIPNILPILTVTGLVSSLDIPFDFATVLIASVSFGLCVDDSIHFVHYYKLQKETGASFGESAGETVRILGRPLVYTTVLFCIGFSVLLGSEMVILIKFGFFTLVALVLAFLSNVMILPAFLKAFDRK